MNQQPRRQGMSSPPARRTGMGEQPRRTGMAQQQGEATEQQPARRAPMGGQAGQPAPPKTQSSNTHPSKTPAPQKTFLNRTGRQWAFHGGIGVAVIIVVAAAAVLGTRWLPGAEPVADFVERYPGQYPQPDGPSGYPWWLNWAHFFNALLMVLIIKTGIQIHTEARPAAYWTPKWNNKRKISLTIWLHNGLDLLWVLNGLAFVLLLIITGYWQRVVPTSWEVLPNAVSAGLQYISLDWPTAVDWAHY